MLYIENDVNKPDFTSNAVNEIFKIPISFIKEKSLLDQHIIEDLELVKTNICNNSSQPIYDNVFGTFNNKIEELIIEQFSKYYTTNINFLKETQELIASCNNNFDTCATTNTEEMIQIMNYLNRTPLTLIQNFGYYTINKKMDEILNKNTDILRFNTMYNLCIPFYNLVYPFFILLIALLYVKINGLELNIANYLTLVDSFAKNHCVYKCLTSFMSLKIEEKVYNLISCIIFFYSIYQNFKSFNKFIETSNIIHEILLKIRDYLTNAQIKMHYIYKIINSFKTYDEFTAILTKYKLCVNELVEKLNTIKSKLCIYDVNEQAKMKKLFYELMEDMKNQEIIKYSMGITSFYNLLVNTNNAQLGICKFDKSACEAGKEIMSSIYHPAVKTADKVVNDVNISNNIIISGSNASGKTTTLKSVLINIILSQQIGYGFYSKFVFYPYNYLHCYLNIPDTADRNSLFQAEAQRCKLIIDKISEGEENFQEKLRHFCVFDELFSGTNPEEAISSGYALLLYLSKKDDVKFIMTTHYIKLCKKFKRLKNKRVINYNMQTDICKNTNNFIYRYKLQKGISVNYKGGLKILKEMNYPQEIINCSF
jgi:hypothetical protein